MNWKARVVSAVAVLTFNKVRRQRLGEFSPSLRWWWTPWTYKFGAGGWVFLSLRWLRRRWE
jgi:hypothetical protein